MIHRYRFISLHHAVYGVARLCRVLAVKRRQGYYEWLAAHPARQEREQAEEALVEQIRAIHAEHQGRYGSPRVHDELVGALAGQPAVGRCGSGASSQSPRRRRSLTA
jgi:hypothetical protein